LTLSKQNFIFIFDTKRQLKIVKKHKNSSKSTFLYSGPSKKNSSHDTIPLRGKVSVIFDDVGGQQAKVWRLWTSNYIRENKTPMLAYLKCD
jgi:hypothetical protein